MGRPRRQKPYNPAAKVHDRRSLDLLRNAQVAPMLVDDPMALEPGEKIVVMRSLRNDPLAGLHSRKQIDEAQFMAGRAFQKDFELCEEGAKAIDTTKEAVDGGYIRDPITDARWQAGKRLKEVYAEIGKTGALLVHDVLIHGKTTGEVAASQGYFGERSERFVGMTFRHHLNCMAYVYGYSKVRGDTRRMDSDGACNTDGLVDNCAD